MTTQRLDIDFSIKWDSRWQVGSGQGTARADHLVQLRRARKPRDHPGEGEWIKFPFVPGAQIKGVLRHQCEMLAAALEMTVVSPHHIGGEPASELLDSFRPLARSGLLVDRLFGSRYQGECLFVDDALPSPEHRTELGRSGRVRLHSRTSIDRVLGTARERTLFVGEVVEGRGLMLKSGLQARHPAGVLTPFDGGFPLEYSLLVVGLVGLESLGGDRSTGMGRCQVAIEAVRWQGQDIDTNLTLASFHEDDWKTLVELYREGA